MFQSPKFKFTATAMKRKMKKEDVEIVPAGRGYRHVRRENVSCRNLTFS